MKSALKNIVFLLGIAVAPLISGAQNVTFSVNQVKEDLDFLRATLQTHHPNAYLYSSKVAFDAFFDSLYQNIPSGMTELETYRFITPVCSIIKDGHTLIFPSKKGTDDHNQNSRFFPFKIYWDGKRMYLELNYTSEIAIVDGAEIIEINGTPVSKIMEFILSRMMRDGNNLTYPVWVLNNWFNEYYSYCYGHPAVFTIQYKASDKRLITKTIGALTKQEIFTNRVRNYPQRIFEKKPNDGITLEINETLKTAILSIKDFHNNILKKTYKQDFGKTMERCFAQIAASKAEHLVLDIRNNQGGDIKNGRILLSYLMAEPFELVNGYFKVNKRIVTTVKTRNRKCKGPSMGLHMPRPDAFKGKLYVLINGGSFSNSGIVSSALKFYHRGVFIGEETGGNSNVIAGHVKYQKLPNTKIRVEVPTVQFALRGNEPYQGKGTIPDYLFSPAIEDMVTGKDAIKEYALELIKKAD
jgi:hypothetical protein